ncbi:MAG: dehydrogenase [Candidatus Saccharibacteria bacterium]|nr:dehydrogenase [Candidatus Saccharibacteria bacterium]
MKKQKVVIVGGGFGGIKTALELAGKPGFSVTLISDCDEFRYYPTLYLAATGGKRAASSIPMAEIFSNKNIAVVRDSIKSIDRKSKTVRGKSKYEYDFLVLALGVVTNYFGIKGLPELSYGIKSMEDAHELRDHIHKQLVDDKKPDLNYVIIGGGPTGVELAAALPHYIRHIMASHGLHKSRVNIDLVEAAPRLMPRMPKPYSKAVAKRLRQLGVKLYLGETVRSETTDGLYFSEGNLKSKTVVWTAGVTNHPFFSDNDFAVNDRGKVVVDEFLAAEDYIYVIGDNADTPFSGMAQTAIHDAKFVADNLGRLRAGRRLRSYKPAQPAYATPVGPSWAALLWGRIHTFGWLGWVLRSAADFIGYRDFESPIKASKHWTAGFGEEKNCLVCSGS